MNEIAVTGANGMTGSHMIRVLKNKKIPFKAITRKEWDLTEWKSFDEFDRIFDSVQAIFHMGAYVPSSIDINDSQTQKVFDCNIRACLNLAEWATMKEIPIIFLSGSSVYKDPYALNINENANKASSGFGKNSAFGGYYGYSKVEAERIFLDFSLKGLKLIILRPSSIYGYGLASEKLVQNFIDMASHGSKIKVNGPFNKINLIHAYDVSNACLNAYKSNSWGVYNIGSKKISSIMEIAETAISISNRGDIEIVSNDDITSDFIRFDLDSGLATDNFGFNPDLSLKEGMTLMKQKSLAPC